MPTPAEFPPELMAYFEASARRREAEIDERLAELTPRERSLVRDAAVMGYVLDRIPLDELTSDAYDALHARLTAAEREADEAIAAAAHLTRLIGKRSEKAEKSAEKQRFRADIAERELRTLRTGLRANGADPTQIQNLWAQIHLRNRQWREEKQRAERAEAKLATFLRAALGKHQEQ